MNMRTGDAGGERPGRPMDRARASRALRAPLSALLLLALGASASPSSAQGLAAVLCTAAAGAPPVECVRAAPEVALPAELTPRQVHALKQRHGAGLVLIDVRTPQETRLSGVAGMTDHVVPVRAARDGADDAAPPPSSAMVDRPSFVDDVEAALRLAGAGPSTPVAVICRTGNRSGIAAKRLRAAGWVNVVNVIGGLDGKPNAFDDDEMGWRAARLPMAAAVDTPL